MKRYEIYHIFVPLTHCWESSTWLKVSWNKASTDAFAEAEKMASEGWELVSATPRVEGWISNDNGCSYSAGSDLFFKRQKE